MKQHKNFSYQAEGVEIDCTSFDIDSPMPKAKISVTNSDGVKIDIHWVQLMAALQKTELKMVKEKREEKASDNLIHDCLTQTI